MANIVRFQSSYIEPYPLQVQGEASYRDNIEDVSGYTGEDEGVDANDFIAQLILEDENEYDPGNAVRVDINGKTVGYLAKMSAKKYRKHLADLGLSDVIGECYASIKGGFIKRSTGEQADFGVRLDLDLDTFQPLPPKQEAPPAPQPMQQTTVATVATAPEVIKPEASPIVKFFRWFFDPGKYRIGRIILFLLLISMACFACIICFGTYLRFVNQ